MRLEMRSQFAYIGIQTQNASRTLEQPKADIDIKTEQPRVHIESTLPRVQIDQSQCFSESGLKGILELASENAKNAVAIMNQSTGRIAEEGNQLADIASGVDRVAENADYNAFGQFAKEFGMVTMPRSRPKIHVIEGKNDIRVTGGTVDINVSVNKVLTNYTPGKVDISLRQRNSLEITVVGDKLDIKV